MPSTVSSLTKEQTQVEHVLPRFLIRKLHRNLSLSSLLLGFFKNLLSSISAGYQFLFGGFFSPNKLLNIVTHEVKYA